MNEQPTIESPSTDTERALVAEQAALLRLDFEDFAFDLLLAEYHAKSRILGTRGK